MTGRTLPWPVLPTDFPSLVLEYEQTLIRLSPGAPDLREGDSGTLAGANFELGRRLVCCEDRVMGMVRYRSHFNMGRHGGEGLALYPLSTPLKAPESR